MATERLSMRKIREILRHKWAVGCSHREVAASLGVSVGAVSAVEKRARTAGLDWLTVDALDDAALAARLYGATAELTRRPLPDPAYLHAERKKPGVTLELLHLEYLERVKPILSWISLRLHRVITRPSASGATAA